MINLLSLERMGFSERVRIPQYVCLPDELPQMKIALYGAGRVGTDYYLQFREKGYDIVCWADKRAEYFKASQYMICEPKELLTVDYDKLFICIEDENIKNEILKELMDMGIEENKCYWSKPFKIF